ncbi:hypothetical protein DID75_04335 [Candidatus Marinamargulisbacteria bacterium SCGC AG-410-N11]|nr:hypothetical protein DID75_04335 [Candidatus Marinamargulisbacteria bacterium SCGC AG-410-N11]
MANINKPGAGNQIRISNSRQQSRGPRQSLCTRVMKGATFIAVSALALLPTVSGSLRGRGLATEDSVRQDLALIESYISKNNCTGFDPVTEEQCNVIAEQHFSDPVTDGEYNDYKNDLFSRTALSSSQKTELGIIVNRVRGAFVAQTAQLAAAEAASLNQDTLNRLANFEASQNQTNIELANTVKQAQDLADQAHSSAISAQHTADIVNGTLSEATDLLAETRDNITNFKTWQIEQNNGFVNTISQASQAAQGANASAITANNAANVAIEYNQETVSLLNSFKTNQTLKNEEIDEKSSDLTKELSKQKSYTIRFIESVTSQSIGVYAGMGLMVTVFGIVVNQKCRQNQYNFKNLGRLSFNNPNDVSLQSNSLGNGQDSRINDVTLTTRDLALIGRYLDRLIQEINRGDYNPTTEYPSYIRGPRFGNSGLNSTGGQGLQADQWIAQLTGKEEDAETFNRAIGLISNNGVCLKLEKSCLLKYIFFCLPTAASKQARYKNSFLDQLRSLRSDILQVRNDRWDTVFENIEARHQQQHNSFNSSSFNRTSDTASPSIVELEAHDESKTGQEDDVRIDINGLSVNSLNSEMVLSPRRPSTAMATDLSGLQLQNMDDEKASDNV